MEKIIEQLRKIKKEIQELEKICEECYPLTFPDFQLAVLADDEIKELIRKHNSLVRELLI